MKILINLLYICSFFVFSSTVISGPFCTVTSYGKDCSYSDFNFCSRQAASLNGTCITNNAEPRYTPQSGNSPFCVVSSYGTDCSYNDINLCRNTARALNGACAVNSN